MAAIKTSVPLPASQLRSLSSLLPRLLLSFVLRSPIIPLSSVFSSSESVVSGNLSICSKVASNVTCTLLVADAREADASALRFGDFQLTELLITEMLQFVDT